MAPWIFNWFPPGQDPITGNAYPLTMPPARLCRLGSLLGATGPQWTPVNQDIPFQPGTLLKFIKVPEAEVDLTITYTALMENMLWQQLAQAAPLFTPTNVPIAALTEPLAAKGTLQIQNPSGDKRNLICTCISGLKIDPSTYRFTSVDANLSFFANYPYWLQAGLPNNLSFFPYNDGQNTLVPPLLPIFINRLGDTIYETTITNTGDVNANLRILINGPCMSPIITNLTFGPNPMTIAQYGVLNMSANGGINLGAGTRLTIDFFARSVVQGVKFPANKISTLTPDSNFWPILPGVNTIRIQLLGATAQTRVRYVWSNTFSTMY